MFEENSSAKKLTRKLCFKNFTLASPMNLMLQHIQKLTATLHQMVVQLANYPAGPKSEMILSFVQNHFLKVTQVAAHPEMSALIIGKSLTMHIMEDLFASSKQNPLFKKQLAVYIQQYFFQLNL